MVPDRKKSYKLLQRAQYLKEMIDDMQSRGITVPDASGSTGTQAGGTPDGSAADNTTADNSDNNTDNE